MDTDFIDRVKLYFMENMFRLVPVAALVLFVGLFVYAVQVDKYNKPPEGLRLPAGNAAGKPSVAGGPEGGIALQNLGAQEVARKLNNIVAESLSFTRNDFAATSAAMQKYFTPAGYKQYQEFLKSSGFEQSLSSQNLRTGAYIETDPLEVTRGAYGGVFKWVYEVPVTITFMPQNAQSYSGAQPENRRFLLRAQFTRVNDDADPDAIRIEIWQILPPRRK